MNWDAIGAIGQMLGSIAVLVTLTYLAAQIRQNTTAVQAGTFQSIIALATTFNEEVAKDPELRRIMRTGLSAQLPANPIEAASISYFSPFFGATKICITRVIY